jgi:hypothetical protein
MTLMSGSSRCDVRNTFGLPASGSSASGTFRIHMKKHAGPGPRGCCSGRARHDAAARELRPGDQLARDSRASRPPGRVPLPRAPAHRQPARRELRRDHPGTHAPSGPRLDASGPDLPAREHRAGPRRRWPRSSSASAGREGTTPTVRRAWPRPANRPRRVGAHFGSEAGRRFRWSAGWSGRRESNPRSQFGRPCRTACMAVHLGREPDCTARE